MLYNKIICTICNDCIYDKESCYEDLILKTCQCNYLKIDFLKLNNRFISNQLIVNLTDNMYLLFNFRYKTIVLFIKNDNGFFDIYNNIFSSLKINPFNKKSKNFKSKEQILNMINNHILLQ